MGPWVSGSGYGPVFEPTFIAHVHYSVFVNPVLKSPANRLVWDMKSSLDTVTCTSPHGMVSLDSIHPQPATSPRLTEICVVSHAFSWAIRVSARDRSVGVTVEDVLTVLSRFFALPLGDRDIREAPPSHRAAVLASHQERISRSIGPSATCIYDWLLDRSIFGGLAHDPSHSRTDYLGRQGEVYFMLSLTAYPQV
ncbi:hypothetical protein CPB85DRAFT_1326707 [Mucidula mucida]|nr:hypothetical protein CPB85DRAFT_1326707 [Mucidula mucida]